MSTADDWTKATPAPAHMLGHVLQPDELLRHARYDHAAPAPELQRWVERYWSVTWQLPPGQERVASTLDDPGIHLTHEWGGVRREGAGSVGDWITGPVSRGRFDVTQHGSGGVVGVRFRLGGTTAFTTAAPAEIRDRTVRAAEWLRRGDLALPDLPDTATAAAPRIDSWLLALAPHDAPGFAEFTQILDVLEDPEVTGTGELERRSGHGTRSLQRRFHRFLGIGPKRMILRARVSDAVAAIDRGDPRSLSGLAHDLGWYDQPHFDRDFRAVTGTTPSAYARGPAARYPILGA